MASSDHTLKQCSRKDKCVNPLGSWLPATREHFYAYKPACDGLKSECKACTKAGQREYSKRPEVAAHIKARTQTSEYKANRRCWEREYAKRPDVRAKRVEKYHTAEYKAYHNALRRTPKYRLKERRANAARREYFKAYYRQPEFREQSRIKRQNRRARERLLPSDFSIQDWQRALDYFHHRCAVCNRSSDLWTVIAADHWIPINSDECPGTIPTNIVPLCHAREGSNGMGACNNSKHSKRPLAWLDETYGKSAPAILKRITDYFEWVGNLENNVR